MAKKRFSGPKYANGNYKAQQKAYNRTKTLERSQELLCGLLQQVKLNYLAQVNRAGIAALMEELDELTAPVPLSPEPPATPQA